MILGELLLIAATVLAIGASALRWLQARRGRSGMARWADLLLLSSLVLTLASFIYLAYLFAISDLDFLYVWRNTSTDLRLMYKISAIWAGKAGSFFLVVLVAMAAVALELRLSRRRRLSADFGAHFQLLCTLLVSSLLVILLALGPFAPTVATDADQARLIAFPDGRGMEMVLQTWEMAIHPLLVLSSYALTVLVFAASASFLITKEEGWTEICLPYARLSWLLLTLGIGIGAYWAYNVVGWSGYWAWDPVETISLVLWLVLAGFLHLAARRSRANDYPVSAPTLGMIVLSTALLAAFVTRSGGLWRSSVHSYGSALELGAGERFIQSLVTDPSLLGLFILILVTAAFAAWMGYRAQRSQVEETDETQGWALTSGSAMSISVILLCFTALVMFLILVKNVDLDQIANYDEFTGKMPMLFGVTAIMLAGCLSLRRLGGRRGLWLVLILIVVSLALALVAWQTGNDIILGFALVPSIVAAVASIYRLLTSGSKGQWRKTLERASPHLIHLGVTFVLVGYLASTFATSVPASGIVSVVGVGEELTADGYSIRLTGLEVANATPPPGVKYDQVKSATFDITSGESGAPIQAVLDDYYRTVGEETFLVEAQPLVQKDLGSDLYVSFIMIDDSTAAVEVKVLPLMNVLWLGVAFVAVGIALRMFSWCPRVEPMSPISPG